MSIILTNVLTDPILRLLGRVRRAIRVLSLQMTSLLMSVPTSMQYNDQLITFTQINQELKKSALEGAPRTVLTNLLNSKLSHKVMLLSVLRTKMMQNRIFSRLNLSRLIRAPITNASGRRVTGITKDKTDVRRNVTTKRIQHSSIRLSIRLIFSSLNRPTTLLRALTTNRQIRSLSNRFKAIILNINAITTTTTNHRQRRHDDHGTDHGHTNNSFLRFCTRASLCSFF